MKKQFMWILAITILIASACCSHAQTKPQEATSETQNLTNAENDTSIYSPKELDLSVNNLPAGYAGNDPEQIYNALTKNFGPKGEFETTQQYQQRLNDANEKPLFGDLTINSTFASTIDHSNDNDTGNAEMHYDADRQIMQITTWIHIPAKVQSALLEAEEADMVPTYLRNIPSTSKNSLSADEMKRRDFVVRRSLDFLGNSIGTTAYGAQVRITNQNINIYRLSVRNIEDFWMNLGSGTKLTLEVPIKLEDAKAAKYNVQTLLVYNIIKPFTKEETGFSTPTIDSPYSGKTNAYYINGQITEIWFYNSQTGEIYYKLRPNAR